MPRADAERNRCLILEAAKAAFTKSGADASLDEIAKEAGVGAGTLYRHFPAREDLLRAVYECEVEKLSAAATELSGELPPIKALRAWMLLFVDHIATKKIIAPALALSVVEQAKAPIHDTVRKLVKRGIKAGVLRENVEATDLLRALVGVAYLEGMPDWQASARRLVDLLIEGSKA